MSCSSEERSQEKRPRGSSGSKGWRLLTIVAPITRQIAQQTDLSDNRVGANPVEPLLEGWRSSHSPFPWWPRRQGSSSRYALMPVRAQPAFSSPICRIPLKHSNRAWLWIKLNDRNSSNNHVQLRTVWHYGVCSCQVTVAEKVMPVAKVHSLGRRIASCDAVGSKLVPSIIYSGANW
jgi:hypothetical protein